MRKPVGRIISSTSRTAKAEFTEKVEEGSILYYISSNEPVMLRVDKLENKPHSGYQGYLYMLDFTRRPPRAMQDLYDASEMIPMGILNVGEDSKGQPFKFDVNPLFNHLLISGMSQQGKTHLCIVLLEELIPLRVPSLVIDPQGEFVNLAEKFPGRVAVVEDIRVEDLVAHLQQRKTVIFNLLGLPKSSKSVRVGDLLTQFVQAKESDYQRAENNSLLLKIPPTLIFIDEVELFAPGHDYIGGARSDALDVIVDIAKRGTKFGMGLIPVPQRVPKLHIEVRSQCNSAVIFRCTDYGSVRTVAIMDFITTRDLKQLGFLSRGQCFAAGLITRVPRIINVRDIETRRAKKVDFEDMLGIKPGVDVHVPKIVKKENGDVVDSETGEVLETEADRILEDDRKAFEEDEGDGVVLREKATFIEDKVLQSIIEPTPENMKRELQRNRINYTSRRNNR